MELVGSTCACWSPIAGFLTALVAAILAWWRQRVISRRRAAIDYLVQTIIGSDEWFKLTTLFGNLTQDGGQALSKLVKPANEEDFKNALHVVMYLNQFELASVAIKNKAMDEKIYKDFLKTVFVESWDKAESYIVEKRSSHQQPTLYENFERLAVKWKS